MSRRTFFLDVSVAGVRGVVTLDGRPERLVLERPGEDPRLSLGARLVARVASVEPALKSAFLDLGAGAEAILPFKPDSRPVRGAALEVEIRSEPRKGKLAVARARGPADGSPRLVAPPPSVEARMRDLAGDQALITAERAREAADDAEAAVLEPLHPLPAGGAIAIEPTRALTAIDVDLGGRKGADAKRVTRQANLDAIREGARLLRLKGLGGLVVFDLVGRGHDGQALLAAARAAFAPDNPGVAIGPVGRFGTMEVSLPRRGRPLLDEMCREDGRLSDVSLALRLVRRLETEAAQAPGDRLVGTGPPVVVAVADRFMGDLAAKFGHRLKLSAAPDARWDELDVRHE